MIDKEYDPLDFDPSNDQYGKTITPDYNERLEMIESMAQDDKDRRFYRAVLGLPGNIAILHSDPEERLIKLDDNTSMNESEKLIRINRDLSDLNKWKKYFTDKNDLFMVDKIDIHIGKYEKYLKYYSPQDTIEDSYFIVQWRTVKQTLCNEKLAYKVSNSDFLIPYKSFEKCIDRIREHLKPKYKNPIDREIEDTHFIRELILDSIRKNRELEKYGSKGGKIAQL